MKIYLYVIYYLCVVHLSVNSPSDYNLSPFSSESRPSATCWARGSQKYRIVLTRRDYTRLASNFVSVIVSIRVRYCRGYWICLLPIFGFPFTCYRLLIKLPVSIPRWRFRVRYGVAVHLFLFAQVSIRYILSLYMLNSMPFRICAYPIQIHIA